MGIMAAFRSFDDFEVHFEPLMQFFSPSNEGGIEGEISPRDRFSTLTIGNAFTDRIEKDSKVGI